MEAVMDTQLWQCVLKGVGLLSGAEASGFTVKPLLLLSVTSALLWMCLMMLMCVLKHGEDGKFILLSPKLIIKRNSLGGLQLSQ